MSTQTVQERPMRRFSPARLAAARKARRLKQREVAERLGHTLRFYQQLEYGERSPTADHLPVLADLLDVTIDGLYAIPDEEESARSDG
jgi:transcriptional regulator with XRE-family HTH domain